MLFRIRLVCDRRRAFVVGGKAACRVGFMPDKKVVAIFANGSDGWFVCRKDFAVKL